METHVRSPHAVFLMPQRLAVPLFQRPYVWNRENQWEPLWKDVLRVADRLLADPKARQHPHFLGAVVFQQLPNPSGSLQVRTVIDGQQRLTTLQIFLDALHGELFAVGAVNPASRVEQLIENPPSYCEQPEDRFKVWPTNRDRLAFNAVMGAEPPVDYETLDHSGERLVEAHRFFAEQARVWIGLNGSEDVHRRADVLERVARELLQLVVIDLEADENAQEIFETLNARGAHLTAADLIKNFVFQRLMEQGEDVETTYEQHWKDFETGFWETETSFGRLKYSRSSIFLNHWLIASTGEEIIAREVFSRFKSFTDFESQLPMCALVERIHAASKVYRSFIEGVSAANPIDRLQLFAYRTSVLESEVFKPVVVWLLEPSLPAITGEQLTLALESLESWLVRRMMLRVPTNSYSQIAAELVTQLRKSDRSMAGTVVREFFAGQNVTSRYWPDDDELRQELRSLLAYKRLRRPRLRMVLEAIEDHFRGWKGGDIGLGGERVARGTLHIEHVMPQAWTQHWPLTGVATDSDRDAAVQTLGNLTLLTKRLNSKVSNGAWVTKRAALHEHDVFKLNARLLAEAGDNWSESALRKRTASMIEAIIEIWPVPAGHSSGFAKAADERPRHRVRLSDLIAAGVLEPGSTVYARAKAHVGRTATILPDGSIDVDGSVFTTPSAAARSIVGSNMNGWWFFLVRPGGSSLSDLIDIYLEQSEVDSADEVMIEGEESEDWRVVDATEAVGSREGDVPADWAPPVGLSAASVDPPG